VERRRRSRGRHRHRRVWLRECACSFPSWMSFEIDVAGGSRARMSPTFGVSSQGNRQRQRVSMN
jgi:hypothetical protein